MSDNFSERADILFCSGLWTSLVSEVAWTEGLISWELLGNESVGMASRNCRDGDVDCIAWAWEVGLSNSRDVSVGISFPLLHFLYSDFVGWG